MPPGHRHIVKHHHAQAPSWQHAVRGLQNELEALTDRVEAIRTRRSEALTPNYLQIDPATGAVAVPIVGGSVPGGALSPTRGRASTYALPTLRDLATPLDYGGFGDGAHDDAGALRACLAGGGAYLPAGTSWELGSLVDVPVAAPLVGASSASVRIFAGAAGAGLKFGPALGSSPARTGQHGGWNLDGVGIVTLQALLALNTVQGTFVDVLVQNGVNDGVGVYGQNNSFIGLGAGGNGTDIALDNGCGGNFFLKPEIHGGASTAHNIAFRQSGAAPAGSYAYPQYNFFAGGIAEFNNNGCLLHQAGAFNYFDFFNFFTNAVAPLVELKNDLTPHVNGRLYFRDCSWTGNGAQAAGGAQVGVQVTSSNADIPLILEGDSIASGLSAFINLLVNVKTYNMGAIVPFNLPAAQIFRGSAGTPIWFDYPVDVVNVNGINGWGGSLRAERKQTRLLLDFAGIDASLATNTLFGTLPAGYRPGATQTIVVIESGGGLNNALTVHNDGTITGTAGAAGIFDGHGDIPCSTYP